MCNRGCYARFLPADLCRELIYIHNVFGVVGYRPHVTSTTLLDLVIAEPRFLPVVVRDISYVVQLAAKPKYTVDPIATGWTSLSRLKPQVVASPGESSADGLGCC
eukprot:GHRR01037308.1.p1 GENE.GHRR01037308.1~~GHRR01037308.1.p1  ORF type:complete len:105 (-),score=12.13 GHRR01037308.1:174-488(-)